MSSPNIVLTAEDFPDDQPYRTGGGRLVIPEGALPGKEPKGLVITEEDILSPEELDVRAAEKFLGAALGDDMSRGEKIRALRRILVQFHSDSSNRLVVGMSVEVADKIAGLASALYGDLLKDEQSDR